MDPNPDLFICPLPQDAPNDTVQMLIVVVVFLIGSGLFARWKKKRRPRSK